MHTHKKGRTRTVSPNAAGALLNILLSIKRAPVVWVGKFGESDILCLPETAERLLYKGFFNLLTVIIIFIGKLFLWDHRRSQIIAKITGFKNKISLK